LASDFPGNVGKATITYTHAAVEKPITVGVHDYKLPPTHVPGTFMVEFTPFLDAKSITVVVDSAANPKVDHNLHLSIAACFKPKGVYILQYNVIVIISI